MRTVACVLKSGGWRNRHMRVEYLPADVVWLRDMVKAHLEAPFRFVCLSDVEIPGVEVIPLENDLPGWWSKLELFRAFTDEPVFYLDLDTVIVGSITAMVDHPHTFTVLRNLSASNPRTDRIGSGLMAWEGDYSHVYRAFMADPSRHMRECMTPKRWGDQGFIAAHVPDRHYWQDLLPGAVVSYKFDLRRGAPRTPNRIVCFHGEPRPWQVRAAWIPVNAGRQQQGAATA